MIFIYTFHFFSTTIHFVFYIFILFAFCLVCLAVSWIRFCQCSAHVVFDVCLFFMSIIIDLLYCVIVFLIIHIYVIIAFSLRYFLFVESNCLLITTMLIIWTILAFIYIYIYKLYMNLYISWWRLILKKAIMTRNL